MFTRRLPAPAGTTLLLGPRGTGKTTWLHEHFPAAPTYDLLATSEQLRLSRDPSAFARECEALPNGSWVVVDEVQRVPALLDEVQRLLTTKRHRFLLSGSSARKLRRGGANLLAGRAEVRHLHPLTSAELEFSRSVDECLELGMLPLAVTSPRPKAFLNSYVETYLREEIQAEALVRQLGSFARFLEVAARMNGQVVNVAGIARDAQVARQTVQDYLQILVDTLIASWLPAWRPKPGVRQVAHPKLYLFDAGVARHLGGVGHHAVHPEERGFLLETWLLHELRAYLHYEERDWPVAYWRTREGAEVDVVVDAPDRLVAFEWKASTRWDTSFGNGLRKLQSTYPERRMKLVGVHRGDRRLVDRGVTVFPVLEFLRALWDGSVV
jgi:predicted AAA+ superfamily ATPase